MDLFMTTTLGKDWKDYFDICVANTKKPLWQRAEGLYFEHTTKSKNLKGRKVTKDSVND
jgi:hypothetical protein